MHTDNDTPKTLEDLLLQDDGQVTPSPAEETPATDGYQEEETVEAPAEGALDGEEEPCTCEEDVKTIPDVDPDIEPGALQDIMELLSGLGGKLEALQSGQTLLLKDFESKLKYDAGKQAVIDRQHEELERYRHEESAKLSKAIILDIINEVDSAEKNSAFYSALEPTPENFAKLLRLLMQSADDMRDLLERHDITSYRAESGEPFNAKRQRVLKTVPTDKPELDRTVNASMRWGFESPERVIRHELVCVNVYKEPAQN